MLKVHSLTFLHPSLTHSFTLQTFTLDLLAGDRVLGWEDVLRTRNSRFSPLRNLGSSGGGQLLNNGNYKPAGLFMHLANRS